MRTVARISDAVTSAKAGNAGRLTRWKPMVARAKAPQPATVATAQPLRTAAHAYASANAAWEIVPSRTASAAVVANPLPWSIARKKRTGPEVRGSPTSQPLRRSPQRRPARVAAAIRAGVMASLSNRLSNGL
jgi:hypothetical protein